MMRKMMLWCILVMVQASYAQTLQVLDDSTGVPISFVTISCEKPGTITFTDIQGKANISRFKEAEEIRLSCIGYKTVYTNYASLKAKDFVVELSLELVSLEQVVVSAYTDEKKSEHTLPVHALQLEAINRQGSYNLSDALDEIPGVSQLSTGPAITKPVVRGLYGNRLLVLMSGLRFDNQQWQDEHGLGLSDIGISKVELIKGPLSLLYGTEAVGGVINLIEEGAPLQYTVESDASVEFHSNTLGGTLQAGTKGNKEKHWYRLRMGTISHADYNDGNNKRVLNSRFNGYVLKASYGFRRKNWKSNNHYHFSFNRFGFIFDGRNNQTLTEDGRFARGKVGPHHNVLLNLFSSVNTFKFDKSTLKLNVGVQSNRRSENEGGNELSLDMHLLTAQYSLKWEKPVSRISSLVIANNSSWEDNTNLGRRKLVPDAIMGESTLSFYLKHKWDRWIMEYGAGGGIRYIKTYLTPTVNSAEKVIDPFERQYKYYNGMAGWNYQLREAFTIKLNVSSGVRAPNLSELSSNGLHEGIYTYEVGDPDMSLEKNINFSLEGHYQTQKWEGSLSAFSNRFFNYIYLEPTGGEWFGFPEYYFKQQDAEIKGGEAYLSFSPQKVMTYSLAYEGLVGKGEDGNYLTYMPAQELTPKLSYEKGKWKGTVSSDFVFQQNLVAEEETVSPGYYLVHLSFGYTHHSKKGAEYSLNLAANNLLNEAYYNHMSRFKQFGLLNMGRDISLHLKIKWNKNINKN